jgi:hypothetical protein
MIRPPEILGRTVSYWHHHKELNDEFVEQVIRLWDQGNDTWAIKEALHESQAVCERALHIGLEARRKITCREIGEAPP